MFSFFYLPLTLLHFAAADTDRIARNWIRNFITVSSIPARFFLLVFSTCLCNIQTAPLTSVSNVEFYKNLLIKIFAANKTCSTMLKRKRCKTRSSLSCGGESQKKLEFRKEAKKKNWCKNAEMQASSMRMQTVER